MSKEAIIWLTIGVYFVFMLVVGIINQKKSKSVTEFTVGTRNASGWASAFSYGTAYFSAVMFIGYAGASGWAYGIWSVLPGIGNALLGSLLAWLVLARRTRAVTRRLKIKSMPQFFEKRFGSHLMKRFAVAVIFIFMIPYSASVYKGLTSVCSVLLGIDETICMIVIAITAAVVIILGGYVAALKADLIQGIIMLFGVSALIIAIIRCQQVDGLSNGLKAISEATKTLNLTGVQFTGLAATVLMTSFGTWGLPQMIHKYYGIRDDKEVTRGTVVSTFFAVVVAVGGYFIGSLSHLFFTELPAGGKDYLIPTMLLEADLPNILLGIVLVLLIAASVSTLSSITLTSASTLTMDAINPHLPEKYLKNKSSVLTKIICLVFIVVSYIIANTDTPILDMMSYSWGVISGSFLAPYLISLYWKKLNLYGAWAGIISGFLTALPPLVSKLFFSEFTVGSFGKLCDLGPHFACLSMLISVITCIAVTLITSKTEKGLNDDFYNKELTEG